MKKWSIMDTNEPFSKPNISVAPIQEFAYMPIFHNPCCLYADPIRYCLCEIYSCIYL